MQEAQQQDPQDTDAMSWENLLQALQKLSQDCLRFTAKAIVRHQPTLACLQDEFAINEDIASQNALKEYLMRQAQQQDPQGTGVMSWEQLLQMVQKLSQDCLGFTATDLACMLGYAAQDAAQVMQHSQAVPAVAAQVLSYINPRLAGTRLAAMNEYRQRDASEKTRGNEQLVQVGIIFANIRLSMLDTT